MGTASMSVLNEAALPFGRFDKCKNDYQSYGIKLDKDQHLCFGFDKGGVDACQGDSGGPIVCGGLDKSLTGVVSFGIGCASEDLYGIYTSLSYYIGWINENVVVPCPAGTTGPYCTEDLDECATENNCKAPLVCSNTYGSYECTCKSGYKLENETCTDINECELDNCTANEHCTNTDGSFSCECQA